MPLPAGLDPALNADPRQKKAQKKGPTQTTQGGDKKGKKGEESERKKAKPDPFAVEKHWINVILKTAMVVALFFAVRSSGILDDKWNGMICFALLRIVTRQQRAGWKRVHAAVDEAKKRKKAKETAELFEPT